MNSIVTQWHPPWRHWTSKAVLLYRLRFFCLWCGMSWRLPSDLGTCHGFGDGLLSDLFGQFSYTHLFYMLSKKLAVQSFHIHRFSSLYFCCRAIVRLVMGIERLLKMASQCIPEKSTLLPRCPRNCKWFYGSGISPYMITGLWLKHGET